MGYLHLPDIEHHRRNKLSPLRQLRANLPGLGRAEKQLRSLTPDNIFEDPYIATILIALAQDGRRHVSNSLDYLNAIKTGQLSMLLATGPNDDEWLHIYTSKVSPECLDRFDYPYRTPVANARSQVGITIYRRKLAFKPYETFSQRLAVVMQNAGQVGETMVR